MRIVGVNIPDNKKIEFSLQYVYGIGKTGAKNILKAAKIDPDKRAQSLDQKEVNRLREVIEKDYKIEGDLRRELMMNIKRLREIKTYRGDRHAKGLPARAQRTKTNSRTRRGNMRKTVGSGRKPAASPT